MKDVLLSVVIISHNQKELLRRCVESVLAQHTDFGVQIIVSDDRSDDGTREMLAQEYGGCVETLHYNSDNAPISLTLQRASYNRLNGLQSVKGKYLIHIDGDDFFTGTTLFQEMVDTLEHHQECDVCCQNFCWIDSDAIADTGRYVPFNQKEVLKKFQIVSAEEFLNSAGYLPNSCYCVRVDNLKKDTMLSTIPYDDTLITARYMRGGKIAIIARYDFVYVRYNASSFNSFNTQEKRILFQPDLQKIILSPKLAGYFLKKNIGVINFIAQEALKKGEMREDLIRYLSTQPVWVNKNFGKVKNISVRSRYIMIYLLTLAMAGLKIKSTIFRKLLYTLSIGKIPKGAKI